MALIRLSIIFLETPFKKVYLSCITKTNYMSSRKISSPERAIHQPANVSQTLRIIIWHDAFLESFF